MCSASRYVCDVCVCVCSSFQLRTTNVCYACIDHSSLSDAVYLYRNMNSWFKITTPCQCKTESKSPAALITKILINLSIKKYYHNPVRKLSFTVSILWVMINCLESKCALSTTWHRRQKSQQIGYTGFHIVTSILTLIATKLYAIVTTEQVNAHTYMLSTHNQKIIEHTLKTENYLAQIIILQ